MDGSEHDYRPCKRVRLGDSFESGTISFSSSALVGGPDHDVYTQAPPRLNFEEAQSINPFVSSCETYHHLTGDSQYARCAELNYQSTTTLRRNIGSSPSALSGTTLQGNDRFSIKDSPGQVCFGMVGLRFQERAPRYSTCEI